MRKISNVLLLIGGIYAIVSAVALFVMGIVFLTGGSLPIITHYLEQALHQAGIDDPDRVALAIQLASILSGVTFLLMAVLCIPSCVVSFAARKNPTKGLLIANIVIGYFCGTTYNVVGGILGLIYNWRLAKKEAREPKVVEAE